MKQIHTTIGKGYEDMRSIEDVAPPTRVTEDKVDLRPVTTTVHTVETVPDSSVSDIKSQTTLLGMVKRRRLKDPPVFK